MRELGMVPGKVAKEKEVRMKRFQMRGMEERGFDLSIPGEMKSID